VVRSSLLLQDLHTMQCMGSSGASSNGRSAVSEMQHRIPHTIDNLCKQEKQRVFDMFKHLTELQERCTSLEEQLASKQLDLERCAGREESMSRQIDATQTKLFQSIELSKELQIQNQDLSDKLIASESRRATLTGQLRDSQTESETLRETIRDLRATKILFNASAQCRIVTCDRAINTDSSGLHPQSASIQTSPEDFRSKPRFPPSSSPKAPRERPTSSREDLHYSGHEFESESESDGDLETLISMLNPL
jgi:hypothetical protein